MNQDSIQADFENWWRNEGSGAKLPYRDWEEHCKFMCEIAWKNGAYKAIENLQTKNA